MSAPPIPRSLIVKYVARLEPPLPSPYLPLPCFHDLPRGPHSPLPCSFFFFLNNPPPPKFSPLPHPPPFPFWKPLGPKGRAPPNPSKPATFGDSIRAAIAPQLSTALWNSWVSDARGEMRAAVLRGAVPRALTGPTRLLSKTGETHRLNDLAQGHVTVVMFWSPACFYSVRDLGA